MVGGAEKKKEETLRRFFIGPEPRDWSPLVGTLVGTGTRRIDRAPGGPNVYRLGSRRKGGPPVGWVLLRVGLQQSAAGWLCAYFWAGIMSSWTGPSQLLLHISTMSFTPSTTSCTCSTSDSPAGRRWTRRTLSPTVRSCHPTLTPCGGSRRQGLRSRQKCLSRAWNAGRRANRAGGRPG